MDRDFREERRTLEQIHKDVQELYANLRMDTLKAKLAELESESFSPDFWNDPERSTRINQEISRLKKKIEPWESLVADVTDARELMDMGMSEEDEAVLTDIASQLESYRNRFSGLETLELLAEEDDAKNAYVTVHAGAGGTESQDWANMLLRMYMRYAEKKGFGIDMVDYMPGEEAGIKGATILVKGEYAFGSLKGEKGVHRLVRISPFDANKRRHTSFASVDIVPELDDNIDVDINENDLRIDTYRSSGAGGQHVNTTDSAVRITHIPTGVVVSCQNERSQHKNKAFAMKVLKAKIYELQKQQREDMLEEKSGEKKDISWGNQIRSYVFQPYTMVKDHRTSEETGSVDYVLDGDLDRFIYAYLKWLSASR